MKMQEKILKKSHFQHLNQQSVEIWADFVLPPVSANYRQGLSAWKDCKKDFLRVFNNAFNISTYGGKQMYPPRILYHKMQKYIYFMLK